ncbi:MAG: DUF975 family protein [Oscillospiraceae bacterium]|jgi:uncharacterized membrane protein|nr:DUF975 family protein [Oscillospiraceae bacterium]
MSSKEHKIFARNIMRQNRYTPYVVGLIFLLISFAVAQFQLRATGMADIQKALTAWYQEIFDNMMNTQAMPDLNAFYRHMYDTFIALWRPLGSLVSKLINLVIGVLTTGAAWYWLRMSRGETPKWSGVFDCLRRFTKILWLMIVTSFFTALWSLLFVIPGIIASIRYSQAIYVQFEHPEYGALECIRESKEVMRDHKMDWFVLQLSFIGWLLLAGIIVYFARGLSVLSIMLIPYVGLANASFYNNVTYYTPTMAVNS